MRGSRKGVQAGHVRCLPGVCLKVKNGVETCKAGAPWPCSSEPRFAMATDGGRAGELEFIPLRNDGLMNNKPKRLFRRWRANADLKPIVSMRGLERYLTKYLTKPEKETKDLRELTATVSRFKGDDAKASSVYIKRLNCLTSRDYSAQEIMHHLLKIPGVQSSRSYGVSGYTNELDLDDGTTKRSGYTNYLNRAQLVPDKHKGDVADLSFHDFVETFNQQGKFAKRRVSVVPRIFPQVFCHSKRDAERYNDWLETQVKLYLPHSDEKEVDRFIEEHDSAEAAVRALVARYAGRPELGPQRLRRELQRIDDADDEEASDEEEDEEDEDEEEGGLFDSLRGRSGMISCISFS